MRSDVQLVTASPTCSYSSEEFNGWLQLIRSEYVQMPGLHLSNVQAQRLWRLDAARCQALLDALESAHFLKRLGNSYVRANTGSC
jgi:hypothetical protein